MDEQNESYQDLVAWQRAMDMVVHIYKHSERWPESERLGLGADVRSAAVSVPSNIAKGYGHGSVREIARCLRVALTSISEIEMQLALAQRVGLSAQDDASELLAEVAEVGRLVGELRRSVLADVAPSGNGHHREPDLEWDIEASDDLF